MEGLEIYPVSTRTVCLNLTYLKPWWVTQGLSTILSCFYNPHQPQVIWTEVSLQLPTPRILKIKGHASHALPSRDTPVLKTDVQMGTYLLFHIPTTKGCLSPCQLVLNGVQSVVRGKKNPSLFSLHLLVGDQQQPSPTDDSSGSNGWRGETVPRKAEGFVARRCSLTNRGDSVGASVEDFAGVEEVTTLLEEDEGERKDTGLQHPDSDDASEDIHKIVLRRLVIDITVLMRRWEQIKTEENLLILLLKPEQRLQAWQFLTSWISVRERSSEEVSSSAPTLTRRKVITRPKQPIASPPYTIAPTPTPTSTTTVTKD